MVNQRPTAPRRDPRPMPPRVPTTFARCPLLGRPARNVPLEERLHRALAQRVLEPVADRADRDERGWDTDVWRQDSEFNIIFMFSKSLIKFKLYEFARLKSKNELKLLT